MEEESDQNSQDSAQPSRWKEIIEVDDPRYFRMRRGNRFFISAGVALTVLATIFVLIQVPLDTTISLRQRNSGNSFGLPIIALFAAPAFLVFMLVRELRDQPKPVFYSEYVFARWFAYLTLAAITYFHLVWSQAVLEAAGVRL